MSAGCIKHPIPTIGGLAIFTAFVLVSLFMMAQLSRQFVGMLDRRHW